MGCRNFKQNVIKWFMNQRQKTVYRNRKSECRYCSCKFPETNGNANVLHFLVATQGVQSEPRYLNTT